MKLVYLAGPDVFRGDAIEEGHRKKRACADRNLVGLYPLDNEIAHGLNPQQMAARIYHANIALLNQATHVVANLNEFRGPSADAGTVFEIGYAVARGIPVLGYADYESHYSDRVYDAVRVDQFYGREKVLVDSNDYLVEEFGLYDNLMISIGITQMFYNDPGKGFQDAFTKALDWVVRND